MRALDDQLVQSHSVVMGLGVGVDCFALKSPLWQGALEGCRELCDDSQLQCDQVALACGSDAFMHNEGEAPPSSTHVDSIGKRTCDGA